MFSTVIIDLTWKASRQQSKHYCTALRNGLCASINKGGWNCVPQ